MIAITALIVTFWVFKGLERAGVLKASQEVISKALSDTKSVAKYCVPKITDLSDFWYCLDTCLKYSPDEREVELQNKLDKVLNQEHDSDSEEISDPYYNDGK